MLQPGCSGANSTHGFLQLQLLLRSDTQSGNTHWDVNILILVVASFKSWKHTYLKVCSLFSVLCSAQVLYNRVLVHCAKQGVFKSPEAGDRCNQSGQRFITIDIIIVIVFYLRHQHHHDYLDMDHAINCWSESHIIIQGFHWTVLVPINSNVKQAFDCVGETLKEAPYGTKLHTHTCMLAFVSVCY